MTLKIPSVFIELLRKRGVSGEIAVDQFLFPKLKDLKQPDVMKNLPEASEIVASYVLSDRPIIVWGDYDVDGTTGTALLVNFFKECGKKVFWHIPNRLTEGYGLNFDWFLDKQKLRSTKDFLLITVDCGISNYDVIENVKAIGGTVVVTDHHSLPSQNIPQCLILNPSQKTCGFHHDCLAGVGVAFYLISGVKKVLLQNETGELKVGGINLKQYLAFVALGTIADVVELTSLNRILVRAGIEALSGTTFVGLSELLISCDISFGEISSEDIGYLIGPKINAAGRLGESSIVVDLFTEQDREKARILAQKMSDLNNTRKDISSENLETILNKTSVDSANTNKCVIEWGNIHQGVAGIVASRLVDFYGFPAIVFARKLMSDGETYLIGSARSIDGVNILELISEHASLIVRYGGHKMAAGLTIHEDNFEKFKKRIVEGFRKNQEGQPRKIIPQYDICCPVKTLMSKECLDFLQYLEPFGPGNTQPVFQDNEAVIVDTKSVGRDKEHLQLTIRGKYSNLKGIGFNLGSKVSEIQGAPKRKLQYSPTKNRYRGTVSWQIRVINI